MQSNHPTPAAGHSNQIFNDVAIVLGIIVAGFTVHYLVCQTKLLKLQINKHEAENGKSKVNKALNNNPPS